jgi:hypothetical protein
MRLVAAPLNERTASPIWALPAATLSNTLTLSAPMLNPPSTSSPCTLLL